MTATMKVGGPMFELDGTFWKSLHDKRGAHYNVYALQDEESLAMDALRELFPSGEADKMNFLLFSTSGVHGTYSTIEEVERWVMRGELDESGGEGPEAVTFLVVQPRIVCTRCGNCYPKTAEDFEFLKRLRQSSWDVVQEIGKERAAKAERQWISVEERLPERDCDTFCYGYILTDEGEKIASIERWVYLKGGGWQTSPEWMTEVTHWMPLPEPPE